MSWDSYLDNLIGGASGDCDKAAIIGMDGSNWTTAAGGKGMVLIGTEGVTLGKCFSTRDFSPLQASGIHLEDVKYQFLRAEDDNIVLGKKKDHGAVTIQASKTALVLGHTKEGGMQGNVNKSVAIIAEYLESLGM